MGLFGTGGEGSGSGVMSLPHEMLGLSKSEESKSHVRNLASLAQAMKAYQAENEQARMNAMNQQLGLYKPQLAQLNKLYGAGSAPNISPLMNMKTPYPQRESMRLATEELEAAAKANKKGGLFGVPILDDIMKGMPVMNEIGGFLKDLF